MSMKGLRVTVKWSVMPSDEISDSCAKSNDIVAISAIIPLNCGDFIRLYSEWDLQPGQIVMCIATSSSVTMMLVNLTSLLLASSIFPNFDWDYI